MRRLVAYDLETHLIQPGLLAPPIVCGSVCELGQRGRLLTRQQALETLWNLLHDEGVLIVGANNPFDFGCACAADPRFLKPVFKAYRDGRVFDILVAQQLNDIAEGLLLKERNGTPLLTARGTQTDRYSLDIVMRLALGRTDAKINDFWRLRYAILEPLPHELWPEDAAQYPVDDAENEVAVAARMLGIDGSGRVPYENLGDLAVQVWTDWCLHLGAMWGLRTDAERVDLLEARATELHAAYVEKFKVHGIFRDVGEDYLPGGKKEGREDPDEGKKDTCALARMAAKAYGARGDCPDCRGAGRVQKVRQVPCRGEKPKGRFLGCLKGAGQWCPTCAGRGVVAKVESGKIMCLRCVGSGFADLSSVPLTDGGKSGVRRVMTDRDTLSESGDELLVELAENKHEKALGTYVPYLRRGVDRPVTLEPNVLVESGRTSYRGVIQLFPRGSLGVTADGRWVPTARECFVARPGRVFGSTDYPAGELCALAMVCLYTVGYSKMAEAINAKRKPGSLHALFGAKLVGTTQEDLEARIAAKDKDAKLARQSAKPCNFGLGGGMGAAKFVLTNRKEGAGHTDAPNGVTYPGIRFCVTVGGAYECGTEKVREWGSKGYEREIPPTCKACLEIVAYRLRPLWFETFPEVKDYHKWVQRRMESHDNVVPAFGPRYAVDGSTHRLRRVENFASGANGGFQQYIADIAKDAERRAVTEAYTNEDSVLYKARTRFIVFQHDELFWEADEHLAHLVAARVEQIMHEAYDDWIPDVHISGLDSALMKFWSKDAEAVHEVLFDRVPDMAVAEYLATKHGWKPDTAGAAARGRRVVLDSLRDANALAAHVRSLGGTATDGRLAVWEPKK